MSADDLAKILDELGRRLGPTGEHVFELAVRKTITEAAFGILTWTMLTVISLIVLVYAHRMHKREIADGANFPTAPTIGFLLGACAAVVAGFGIVSLIANNAIVTLLNPEYSAIENILKAVHP